MSALDHHTPHLLTHLASKSLNPTPTWLAAFLAAQKPTTPLPALKSTLLFRLLASDITSTLSPASTPAFPSDILDPGRAERRIPGPVVVQVLSVDDVGRSRWSQVEALEAVARGEGSRGREVVRVVAGEEGLEGEAGGRGPHKVVLQDVRGVRVFAVELESVDGVGLGMNIGSKMVLRDVLVARGVVLLEVGSVAFLGGKIEGLHRRWVEGRKEALMAAVSAGEARERED